MYALVYVAACLNDCLMVVVSTTWLGYSMLRVSGKAQSRWVSFRL